LLTAQRVNLPFSLKLKIGSQKLTSAKINFCKKGEKDGAPKTLYAKLS